MRSHEVPKLTKFKFQFFIPLKVSRPPCCQDVRQISWWYHHLKYSHGLRDIKQVLRYDIWLFCFNRNLSSQNHIGQTWYLHCALPRYCLLAIYWSVGNTYYDLWCHNFKISQFAEYLTSHKIYVLWWMGFVCKFKILLSESIQIIGPIHRKICILLTSFFMRDLRYILIVTS